MKKIYLNDHFMTRFLFEGFFSDGVEYEIKYVSECFRNPELPFLLKILKVRVLPFLYLALFYLVGFFYKSYVNKQSGPSPSGEVFYFSIENMYELTRLLYSNKKFERHILWIWNPASSFGKNKYDRFIYLYLFIPLLKFVGVEIWSFDKADAEKYRFTYHPQVHNSMMLIDFMGQLTSIPDPSLTFLFVGLDKGRLRQLSQLRSILSDFNVMCRFHITRDLGAKYSEDDLLLTKDCYIPYEHYLSGISESSGLIDLVQNGQSGLTLRVLEAVFLKKKLITNNASLRDYDFFDPSNIYIFDEHSNVDELAIFLRSKFVEIDGSILMKYELRHLVQCVFNEASSND